MGAIEDLMKRTSRKFVVVLEKLSKRQLNEAKVKKQLSIIKHSVSRNKQRRMLGGIRDFVGPTIVDIGGEENYRYRANLIVRKEGSTHNEDRLVQQFEEVMRVVNQVCNGVGWHVHSEDIPDLESTDFSPAFIEGFKENQKAKQTTSDITIPALNEEAVKSYFSRIFDREAQIAIMHQAALTAVRSKFNKRRCVIMHGPPGTAKTELLDCFVDFYGADLVWKIDATQATRAGLAKNILSRAQSGELPPFLFISEIEKQKPEVLDCLLGIMDGQGRIERTLATTGQVSATAKVFVAATCNDVPLLKSFHAGALWSRFPHRLYCPRPTKPQLERILTREVTELCGEETWVKPVLDFCWDELKTNDPRVAAALLDGGDGLLGSAPYLNHYRTMLASQKMDKVMDNDAIRELLG